MAHDETRYQPKYPEVFGSEYEDEIIHNSPDGSEELCKSVSFRGERDEVLDELKKIIANWPAGMYENGKFDVSIGVSIKIKQPTKKYIPDISVEQRFGSEFPDILSENGCLQHMEVFANGAERLSDHISGEGSSAMTLEKLKEIIANWPHGLADKGKFRFSISMKAMIKGKLPSEDTNYQASI